MVDLEVLHESNRTRALELAVQHLAPQEMPNPHSPGGGAVLVAEMFLAFIEGPHEDAPAVPAE